MAGDAGLCEYELIREANIREREAMFRELGIQQLMVGELSRRTPQTRRTPPQPREATEDRPEGEKSGRRRSQRVAKVKVSYIDEDEVETKREKKRKAREEDKVSIMMLDLFTVSSLVS